MQKKNTHSASQDIEAKSYQKRQTTGNIEIKTMGGNQQGN